jgi:signal recognition particle receptor subunit beta
MVFFNYTTMQMTAKIVYYGPGLGGKTTNLQHIHKKTASASRGEMVSLETETDRTLFFDLLPLDVGVIGGMKVRLQLYTVPGQVFYNATRKLVLKGADGIVFVADSQQAALDANIESRQNLETNLNELGMELSQIPFVLQYNKRDIRNIHPVGTLNEALNPSGAPFFEAAALHGIGVFETLKIISRLALTSVRKKLAADAPRHPGFHVPAIPGAPVGMMQTHTAGTPVPAVETPAVSFAAAPLAPGDDLSLEFAEDDTAKHSLRPVTTRGHLDIQRQLEELRAMTVGRAVRLARPAVTRGVDRRLEEILVSERESRPEVKRKASIDVPAELLRGSSAVRLHVAFDGDTGEETIEDVVTVKLAGNRRLDRLTLHLDIELKGKSGG